MFQLIGLSVIIAAWAVPILFVGTLGFLFGLAVFRPLFLAWARAWDAAAGLLAALAAAAARSVLSRTDEYAVRHARVR